MVWLGALLLVVLVVVAVVYVAGQVRRRREAQLVERQYSRMSRRAALDDLRALGRPVDLVSAATTEVEVRDALVELRREAPGLDPPCSLDPGHGPADRALGWAEDREVQVCPTCAGTSVPRPKMVRRGDRLVPWFAAGRAYDAYAHGWFGADLDVFRAESAALLRWDHHVEPETPEGRPTMGAGWYGVLLAANHRMGKYSSG